MDWRLVGGPPTGYFHKPMDMDFKHSVLVCAIASSLAVGCREEEGIRHYRIPKESPAKSWSDNGKMRFLVPEQWEKRDSRTAKFSFEAVFRVPEGDQVAMLTVSESGGSLLANINRWRGQLQLPDTTEEELKKELKYLPVAGTSAAYIELTEPGAAKPDQQTILGAVVSRGSMSWFFKLTGPRDVIQAQKKTFEQFVQSVEFVENSGAKNG